MAFCIKCGHATATAIPEGDSHHREVCPSCHHIHYENPKVICGALAIWQDKVLLCRRAIEPRYGLWTLPAGFMELQETMQQGAARETWEEAEAKVKIDQLYCSYNIPRIGQVYMLFKGTLENGEFGAGEESLECALFDEADIPWDSLAFPSIYHTLKHYYHDRKTHDFSKAGVPFHLETLSGQGTVTTDL
jgi:ADP-ribose pyrophosphatase YjhB (NUDIX family)